MLMLKNLGSALVAVAVLGLGAYSAEVAAKPHGPHMSKHQQEKKNTCKQYLERRAAWYRYKGNKAELRENRKAEKAFRGLPYAEQKIQCQAAYQAFDDFDHGKFRRR
ncbi:stress response protein [Neisseria sp.]